MLSGAMNVGYGKLSIFLGRYGITTRPATVFRRSSKSQGAETMSEMKHTPGPREWLLQGGGGHEDGADGLRALTLSGEALVEMLEAYREALGVDRLQADSKKLREPATCNAGHKSNLPLALWDCPVCTQLLRDSIQEAKQVTQEVLRLHHGNSEPCRCFHCRKAREVEAALGGKAHGTDAPMP